MRRILGCGSFLLALSAASGAAADASTTEPPTAPPDELLDRLAQVPGLTFVDEQLSPAPGFRFLVLTFTQPVDHNRSEQGTFQQTLTLLHRSFDAPTVAFTTGYDLPIVAFRDEPTALVDGNQLGIEERFFASSRPEPADYRDVDIYQAAADHHRVIDALKSVYAGRWLSTGASKGGMATVYHRRFFPDDVDGSIAYVAPNDVVNSVDAYDEFFEHVGSDPACEESLWHLQRRALSMRDEIQPWLTDLVADIGCTFEAGRSMDEMYEALVVTLDWGFWQSRSEEDCPFIPGPDAYPFEVLDYVGAMGALYACDGFIESGEYITYYYQAGTELGWPAREYPHLKDLLRYPGAEGPRTFVPADIPMHFDPFVMDDIDHWVRSAGSELMFIYGENDPWGAEPFELGAKTRDSYWYLAPGVNHSYAGIATLTEPEQLEAANTVRRWAGLPPFGSAGLVAPSSRQNPVQDAVSATELDGLGSLFRQGRRL
jgi:hypothetical protein